MFGLGRFFKKNKTEENQNHRRFPPVFQIVAGNNLIRLSDVNRQFSALLLGVNSPVETELNEFENQSLSSLEKILEQQDQLTRMLPRLPLVLPRLMKALREENANAEQIAALIKEDPVLVADVMRLTESPFYKTRSKITSLEHAVVLLGREGIKRLVASAVLKPLLNNRNGFFMKMSSATLWEHAEKTSIVAYDITDEDEEIRFHAYLGGLLLNLGYTVGLKLLDKHFDSGLAPNSRHFFPRFEKSCQLITVRIAEVWDMPENIINAFRAQADNKTPSATMLDENLYIADLVAKTDILSQRLGIRNEAMSFRLNDEVSTKILKSYLHLQQETQD